MLTVLGYVSLFFGSVIYNIVFKDYEIKSMLKYSLIVRILSASIGLIWVLRLNLALGISDLVFTIFTDVIAETLGLAFTNLPSMVLFAKITPHHIEATCFAFLTGTLNLTMVISGFMGSAINSMFVHVTNDDLSNFYILLIVQMICCIIPFFFLDLIPTKKQCEEL
mmetsp:Transcript_13826/g.18787  ORF Transcript_13826/g.18787 Transcript_13826/m.18787 type:complete len:166 (-) Transcript_13826:99-596(-)